MLLSVHSSSTRKICPTLKKSRQDIKFRPYPNSPDSLLPPTAPKIDFLKPLSKEEERTSLDFFSELNFLLQFCPVDTSEVKLMESFAKIDVGGGLTFNPEKLSPEMKQAIQDGVKDAWKQYRGIHEN